ncbi:MAG: hypothetical protein P4L53_04605 [Candidatus Obscuribacterales bacterium]|nr:hypothetical protein [Candidatus Obscuribacterales bacterium]
MSYDIIPQTRSGSLARRLQILSAAALSLSVFIGSVSAAFIFICGMKFMDGAQGAQNEGPLMIILPLLAPYLAWFLWKSLRPSRDRFGYSESFGMKYGSVAGVVAYLGAATIVGTCMSAVNWGNELIQLKAWSLVAAFAAVLVAGLGVLNFFATRRAGGLST